MNKRENPSKTKNAYDGTFLKCVLLVKINLTEMYTNCGLFSIQVAYRN